MKNRIKILIGALTIAIAATTAGTAFAKGKHKMNPEHMEQKIEKRLAKMTEHLELTEAQQAKVRVILESKKDTMIELHKNENLTREEKREQFKAAREDVKAQIDQVLTAEQQAKAEEFRKNRKEHKKHKRGKRGKHMLKHMVNELDLTDAQQASAKKIMEDAKTERETILEANNGDRAAAKEELKAHRTATKAKLRALLTEEQAAKFDEMKAKRGKRGKRGKGKKNKF